MSRKTNLVKNTFILSLGTFFPGFITILVTPILTAHLTKAEYGEYDLVVTVVSLLLPAVTLQISAASFRFLIDTRDDSKRSSEIITTIYSFVVMMSILSNAIYILLFRNKLGENRYLICIYFVTDILFMTSAQMVRGLGKNLLYAISSIIKSLVNIILIALLVGVFGTTNYGISGVLIAMIFSTLIPTLFLFFWGGLIKFIHLYSFSFSLLKQLLRYSWPMVPNNLSGWILKLSDRLVITMACGIEVNAIYAVACKLPTILNYFQTTFMQAWQENSALALKDDDKDSYYSQMCNWIYRLFFGFMSVLICTTPIIWRFIVKGNYDEAYYQLPMLYLGVLFSCMASILGAIYTAHMKSKSVGITTSMAAGINLLVDIAFVKHIGIWAGSISTMISYFFLLTYRMRDIQKFQKIEFDMKTIVYGILTILFMGILCYQKNMICDLSNIVICVIAVYSFDKDIILAIINIIRKKFFHT